jgi:hypothetical protein
MTPDQFNFTGDAVTFLGLIGVVSTGIIIVTAFRRFFNSPMNFRVPVSEVAQDLTQDPEDLVS